MREITKIIEAYTYQELPEEAQDKVKDYFSDMQNEYFFDLISKDLNQLFPNSGLKVQYSLSSCQGDGLNIYGTLKFIDILDKLNYTDEEKHTLLEYFKYTDDEIKLDYNNRYCYSLTFILIDNIEELVQEFIGGLDDTEFTDIINKELIKKFYSDMLNYISELEDECEEEGYKCIYFEDEYEGYIVDLCNSNGYEFTEDGEII